MRTTFRWSHSQCFSKYSYYNRVKRQGYILTSLYEKTNHVGSKSFGIWYIIPETCLILHVTCLIYYFFQDYIGVTKIIIAIKIGILGILIVTNTNKHTRVKISISTTIFLGTRSEDKHFINFNRLN